MKQDLPAHVIAEAAVTISGTGDPIAGNAVALHEVAHGMLRDPFALLGPQRIGGRTFVRTFQPGALAVEALARGSDTAPAGATLATLKPINGDGLFSGVIDERACADGYVLRISWPAPDGPGGTGIVHQYTEDPYSFGLLLGELDLHLIAEGRHVELGRCLGAQLMTIDGVEGTRFAVWAPTARRVSVVGDFNYWDGRRHPMRMRHEAGVWELFIPRLKAGALYRYEIVSAGGELLPQKADPVAHAAELPPATASVVADVTDIEWHDHEWMTTRAEKQNRRAPISIYEVHPASWMRAAEEGNRSLDWNELAQRLIPYVRDMGFTHIELLPVMEHPFGGSWGYQPLGLFAPSARFGSPVAFASFVDRCHQAGLGVILDWVPAHFPADAHGLVRFDGSALYEHEDPREGFHPDWNTLIYNFGRKEVRGFLIASALEWLERYHVDGLRVDAVSSMLYRDYSRKPGEWLPNRYGGRENLEAVAFLRELNQMVAQRCPGAMVIAEESTAWPGVTQPPERDGLGFAFKWNMGWMHDTLRYIGRDPLYRGYHHHDMTFGLHYAFSENYVLAISHDEVVHGKGSLLGKMPGDAAQRLANLRAYLGFMWTHPGKKLLFMGCEFGQEREWNHDASLQWELLAERGHQGVQKLVSDLNRLYAREPALYGSDSDPAGFTWLVGDDNRNSVFAFLRNSTDTSTGTGQDDAATLLVVCNMTPGARHGYRIGVPADQTQRATAWRELLNTDAGIYGGGNMGNFGNVMAQPLPCHGQATSVELTLPPLSVLVFRQER